MSSEQFADRLRSAGLHATAPRIAVMSVLDEHRGHHEVRAVAELARQRLGTLSIQATYNVLDALTEVGLARRIQPAGSPALFEMRVGDNHHHLVCRRCGQVQDVDCVVGEAPCLEPSTPAGLEIDEAEITFWGICDSCSGDGEPVNVRQRPSPTAGTTGPQTTDDRRRYDGGEQRP